MKSIFCLFFVLFSTVYAFSTEQETHDFCGKHFLASYVGCNQEALADVENMIAIMDEAVRSSGATTLDKRAYIFEPNGLTMVYLLSESHASIHTYPEHGACFVDLFTCGDHCSSNEFDSILRAYLQPDEVDSHLFLRHLSLEELSLENRSGR